MTLIAPDAAALAARIPDGASVVIAKDPGAPTALAAALVARGAKNLHIITAPTSGYVTDMLIGAGAVRIVETSGVTLGEHGLAPAFIRAVKTGRVEIRDSTCPAVYAALQAGEKGQPFAPLRGLIGSDLMRARPDYKVIEDPMTPGEQIALLPAIRPDAALIHAELADARGNVYVGPRHELKMIAHAAHAAYVTVEEIWDGDLARDPLRAPNLITPLYIGGVAEARQGAWPNALPGRYEEDPEALAAYAAAARSEEGFADWLDSRVFAAA